MSARPCFLLLPLAMLACGESPTDPEALRPQMAAVTETFNEKVPFAQAVFVPCADGGVGEDVLVEGTLHTLLHTTTDNTGGFHTKGHFQPQGAKGTGQTTGDTYNATGVTQDRVNLTGATTQTYINNFRLIGPGPGNNLLVHQTVHITVNANGEVTVDIDNLSVECK